jgi:hypothetical protein
MQDLEPYHRWRDYYVASEDEFSPFFEMEYSEFTYTNKIYNYYIHPQWDDFGSETMYIKVLFVDYEDGFAILELIGEWNDAIGNDIMLLKRDLMDVMMEKDIFKFIFIAENVLNFHASDDSYYEELYDDISDENGWVAILNTPEHVTREMQKAQIQHFVNLGGVFEEVNWRPHKPERLFAAVDALVNGIGKQIGL